MDEEASAAAVDDAGGGLRLDWVVEKYRGCRRCVFAVNAGEAWESLVRISKLVKDLVEILRSCLQASQSRETKRPRGRIVERISVRTSERPMFP